MGRAEKPVIREQAHRCIAAYLRLSKADGRGAEKESNSISMQRELIRAYIAAHFVGCPVREYVDDGFSGTGFERPGVQQLLSDARNGAVDCIIVKDFSRFGRDYVEVGAYLEQIFPFLGIRFISINDRYDSGGGQGNPPELDVNFKNLLYDLYSRDLSQKVKGALRARKEGGQYISAVEPFGYEKSPDDRHALVICEEEAAVVRRIFALAKAGVTSSQTAKLLNAEHVPTPTGFKIRKGKSSRKPKGEKFFWDNTVICSILRNPLYAGDMVYGKTKKGQVGGKNVLQDRADWKVVKDHHAPVIDRETFEEVQKSRGKGRGNRKQEGRRHPLIGLAVCGCCGHNLQIREGKNPYFTCKKRYVTGQESCVGKVNAMFFEQAVLFRLEEYLEKQRRGAEAADSCRDRLKEERAALLREEEKAQRAYEQMKKEHSARYEAYALGEQDSFCTLRKEMEKQREAIRGLRERIAQADERLREAEAAAAAMEEAGLKPEMIKRYVGRVVVYSEEEFRIEWKKA